MSYSKKESKVMVELNSVFTGRVRDLASDGRGVVVHPSGQTVFVAGVWEGEEGAFKVVAKKGRALVATLVELTERSPHRVEPGCRYHGVTEGRCGGCPWMFVANQAQLDAKAKRVRVSFSRIGAEDKVRELLAPTTFLGYRNRAQFKTDGEKVGFFSCQSNQLVDIEHCEVLTEKNNLTLTSLRALLPYSSWRPAKKNQWTTLDIDETVDAAGVSVNQRLPFMQGNSEQNKAMRSWLAQKLFALSKDNTVIELFCGSGNFTEVIAAHGFERVIAIEGVEKAIEVLESKNLANVKAITANLFSEQVIDQIFSQYHDASVLVLDPPRDGLKVSKGIFSQKKSKLRDVFYISCDLATLMRDVKTFLDHGYSVVEVQPLDQFPHTAHIEILVHLKKTSSGRKPKKKPFAL